MNFWDSSALIAMIAREPQSAVLMTLTERHPDMAWWWGTRIECLATVGRFVRGGITKSNDAEKLKAAIIESEQTASLVMPDQSVKNRAERLLEIHPLDSGDAFQLAAALIWCNESPAGRGFVCLDKRLREAARREGFTIHPA